LMVKVFASIPKVKGSNLMSGVVSDSCQILKIDA
jgi:hypothetical protein